MRAVRLGIGLFAVALLLGTATPARACWFYGSVACSSDPSIGVSGVSVTFTEGDGTVITMVSAADGSLFGHLDLNTSYDVSYTDLPAVCTSTGAAVYLDPILVDDPVQCPGTPPACVPEIPAGVTFPYCPARPLGNPRAECGFFGLTVLDKDEGAVTTASTDADLAIVKAGGCYGIYVGVQAGDAISSPVSQAISHVTYCVCD